MARLYGATPDFDRAGNRVAATLHVSGSQTRDWWNIALRVMQEMVLIHAPLSEWFGALKEVDPAAADFDAVGEAYRALARSRGVPDYPVTYRLKEDGDAVWFVATPYLEFNALAFQLVRAWLNLAFVALTRKRTHMGSEPFRVWRDGFERLRALLPPVDVMELHRRLGERNIPFNWRAADATQIGQGAKSVLHRGADEASLSVEAGDWRIPIYTVTGSIGKTTTSRLLWMLLKHVGGVGLTSSYGVWLGDEQLADGDCIGGASAFALLQNRRLEAAVFEQGRGGIMKQGVPYTHSDIAILLNVLDVHVGIGGVDTLEAMADVKAIGLRPAQLAVLNFDDEQCRRIGALRSDARTAWFSVSASSETLHGLSLRHAAATGVERDASRKPLAIAVWRGGQVVERCSLADVAPYHGFLGETTVAELLAVVTAAVFGPLRVDNIEERLRALSLDADNHLFRTSIHQQGRVTFVLDKAGEAMSLDVLREAIDMICDREGISLRIAAVTRSASDLMDRHRDSAARLYEFCDEFVCFDRPDTYEGTSALPGYEPGSIPLLFRDAFAQLNRDSGQHKPVEIADEWAVAETILRDRIAATQSKILVLVNQPATAVHELNQRILSFVNGWQE
ncbi:MAG: hypothetical protein KDE55_19925 [Novosphingobium sp.]|nr:hypothetical protein [Novosphingobium sp.]